MCFVWCIYKCTDPYIFIIITIVKKDMTNLKKIIAENNRDYHDILKSIEKVINIGDRLSVARTEFDTAADFSEWVDANHEFKYRQAIKYMRISTHKAQARLLNLSNPDISIDGRQLELPKINEEPLKLEADSNALGYVGQKPGTLQIQNARDSDNWHTPQEYVEAAREVLTTIDLDPFSDHIANQSIRALRILTLADNALELSWANPETRTVWMNPPYSRGMSSLAVDKFIDEFNYGSFDQAIVLMNSSTDTNWFHRLALVCTALCFTKGRIAFIDGDGGKRSSGNTKGQVFFYFGKNIGRFRSVFSKFGLILPHSTGGAL